LIEHLFRIISEAIESANSRLAGAAPWDERGYHPLYRSDCRTFTRETGAWQMPQVPSDQPGSHADMAGL